MLQPLAYSSALMLLSHLSQGLIYMLLTFNTQSERGHAFTALTYTSAAAVLFETPL
jgi:hypothetical protein